MKKYLNLLIILLIEINAILLFCICSCAQETTDCVENFQENESLLEEPEILAFQTNTWSNSIRILAGMNDLNYESVGFEITPYVSQTLKKEVEVNSNYVFESILENGNSVYASSYGYKYFSVLTIDEVKNAGESDNYLIITPYVVKDSKKHYGVPVKINVSNNGYSFDKNFIFHRCTSESGLFELSGEAQFMDNYAELRNYGGGITLTDSFDNGRIYLKALAEDQDTVKFNIYVDDILVNYIEEENSKNTFVIGDIEKGNHKIRIETLSDTAVKIYGVSYLKLGHQHTVSDEAEWSLSNNTFYTKCQECDSEFNISSVDTPALLLTFDKNVKEEAEDYDGFTIVSPNDFSISNGNLTANKSLYIDVEQETLAKMPFYVVSSDITVSKKGSAGMEISLVTLISNYRNGAKVSGKTSDMAYFVKYNVNEKKFATIKINGASNLLTTKNSLPITVGQKYKFTFLIDNMNNCVHTFIDEIYIGKSEKAIADVMSEEKFYPSFKLNDGGNCVPIYDNFSIYAVE